MLAKCVNCEFNLSPDEKLCRNCGLFAPTENFQYASENLELNLTVAVASVLTIVCAFGFAYNRYDESFDWLSELPVVLLLSGVICFAISYFIVSFFVGRLAKKERRSRFAYQKTDATLNDFQDTITLRNHELSEKYSRIEESAPLQDDASEDEELNRQSETAMDSLDSQIARYEIHNQKIELMRLQNELLPIFYEKNLREKNSEISDTIDEALAIIEDMRSLLVEDYADFSENALPEKEGFSIQLDKTEAVCKALREKHSKSESVFDLTREPEAFNLRTNMAKFIESFRKLESEYERLKEEHTYQETLAA